MLSRQYIVWCVMLGLLILSAVTLLAGGFLIASYVVGAALLGPKVSAAVVLIAAVLFLIPYRWFIEVV